MPSQKWLEIEGGVISALFQQSESALARELVIVDGAPGLAALWPDVLVQRCTVHKHRNLLAHAPERLHEELSADYKDMIDAGTKQEADAKRKAFIRKWRLKCPAAASLEEAGDKLFTFTPVPRSQWKSIRSDRTIARGVQAPDQDSDRSAISGNSGYVVPGSAGFGADHNAQSRRLADPQRIDLHVTLEIAQKTNSNRNRDGTDPCAKLRVSLA